MHLTFLFLATWAAALTVEQPAPVADSCRSNLVDLKRIERPARTRYESASARGEVLDFTPYHHSHLRPHLEPLRMSASAFLADRWLHRLEPELVRYIGAHVSGQRSQIGRTTQLPRLVVSAAELETLLAKGALKRRGGFRREDFRLITPGQQYAIADDAIALVIEPEARELALTTGILPFWSTNAVVVGNAVRESTFATVTRYIGSTAMSLIDHKFWSGRPAPPPARAMFVGVHFNPLAVFALAEPPTWDEVEHTDFASLCQTRGVPAAFRTQRFWLAFARSRFTFEDATRSWSGELVSAEWSDTAKTLALTFETERFGRQTRTTDELVRLELERYIPNFPSPLRTALSKKEFSTFDQFLANYLLSPHNGPRRLLILDP